jgi:hypothetical protein
MNALYVNVINFDYYGKLGKREAIVWREHSEDPERIGSLEHGYIPIQNGDAAKYKGKPIDFLKKIKELDDLLDDYYEFDDNGDLVIKDVCDAIYLNGGTLFKESYIIEDEGADTECNM